VSRVLIVEDSVAQSAIIADIVRQAGHQPIVYNSLPVGVSQIVLTDQPDLVLLDLRLADAEGNPIADGFQLCREIKKTPLRPPVVIITAEGDDEACQWALLQGADAYIQKPFAPDDLTQIMAEILST
jgi:DNA-binding response OmpR family regulator